MRRAITPRPFGGGAYEQYTRQAEADSSASESTTTTATSHDSRRGMTRRSTRREGRESGRVEHERHAILSESPRAIRCIDEQPYTNRPFGTTSRTGAIRSSKAPCIVVFALFRFTPAPETDPTHPTPRAEPRR